MTTICASATYAAMAADSRVSVGPVHFPSTKIYRIGGLLVGGAGLGVDIAAFLAWVENNPDFSPDSRPTMSAPDNFEAMVLCDEGIFVFEWDCVPCPVDREFHAIGTGAQAAIAAMMLRATPKRAIEIACRIDCNSGGPVAVLKLEDNI
jgi:ATP-dependent protease HslVU (ClpYQ) peptidase subunit